MSPGERRLPYLHARQAWLQDENNRLRAIIRTADWRNTSNELASIQATIADNERELDELEQVLTRKIDIPINTVLLFLLVITIAAWALTQV